MSKRTIKQSSTVGRKSPGPELIRGMKQLRDAVKSGTPLPTRTYVCPARTTMKHPAEAALERVREYCEDVLAAVPAKNEDGRTKRGTCVDILTMLPKAKKGKKR